MEGAKVTAVKAAKVSFQGRDALWDNLSRQFRDWKRQPGVRERGYRRLHRKAMIISLWAIGSYVPLAVFATALWQAILIGPSLVLALAAAAFCIMHDGNHGSFSRSKLGNWLASFMLEVLGGCSPTWKVKHNDAHHGAPNVDGIDEDIDQPPFARLASTQEWKPWYRWQHLYLWPVYGLVVFRWVLFGDLVHLIRGRISRYELKVSRKDIAVFIIGKLLFFGWTVGIPLAVHPSWHRLWVIAVVFAAIGWLFSFVMVTVFQLAHCVDEALFTSVDAADENGKLPYSYPTYQILATTDFCEGRRFLTWLLGGLNFQIVHHLFPKEPHVHYPAIAEMVRVACRDHGVKYNCQPTLRKAVASHYRHLRNMGRPPQAVAQ